MSWLRIVGIAAFLVIVGDGGRAEAFGGRWWGSGRTSYMPAPMMAPVYALPTYALPAYGQPLHCPVVLPLPMLHAQPTPAPPSGTPPTKSMQTREPPLNNPMSPDPKTNKRAPAIIESRSLGGDYAEGTPKVKQLGDRCKVGFWNVSGKDVRLRIGARDFDLPRDRAITLELERQFAWQIGQREATSERVPANQAFFEVIIRE